MGLGTWLGPALFLALMAVNLMAVIRLTCRL
jgi:hypothetical protein